MSRNKLRFSLEKTEVVVFKRPHLRSPVIRLNGARVRCVPQTKYLGVILDRKLNFSTHVTYVCAKTRALTSHLRTLAVTRWGLRSRALRVFHKGAVVPQATYAASISGPPFGTSGRAGKIYYVLSATGPARYYRRVLYVSLERIIVPCGYFDFGPRNPQIL